MASPINKEGRRLEFRRGTAAQNHKLENYEGFTQQKKEDLLLLHTLILTYTLNPHPQLERKQLNLSYHLLNFTFRLLSTRRSTKHQNTELVPEVLTALTALPATFTLPLPYT